MYAESSHTSRHCSVLLCGAAGERRRWGGRALATRELIGPGAETHLAAVVHDLAVEHQDLFGAQIAARVRRGALSATRGGGEHEADDGEDGFHGVCLRLPWSRSCSSVLRRIDSS